MLIDQSIRHFGTFQHFLRHYGTNSIQEQALTLFNDSSEMTEEQKSSHRVREQQLDTSRAYSLLLYHADVKRRKESIIEEIKD